MNVPLPFIPIIQILNRSESDVTSHTLQSQRHLSALQQLQWYLLRPTNNRKNRRTSTGILYWVLLPKLKISQSVPAQFVLVGVWGQGAQIVSLISYENQNTCSFLILIILQFISLNCCECEYYNNKYNIWLK